MMAKRHSAGGKEATGPRVRLALFVCTGNSCRSPMAEALFRARMAGRGGWEAASAGTFASAGQPASEQAQVVMQELGIDLRAHRSQPVTPDLIRAADWIVPMTRGHRDSLLDAFPEAAAKIRLLSDFQSAPESKDIPDPIGQDVFVYRRIRDRLDSAIADFILFVVAQPGG